MNRRLWFSMLVAPALAACAPESRDEANTGMDGGSDVGADVGASDTSDGGASSADARADADSSPQLDGATSSDASIDAGVTLSPRYEVEVTTHVYGQGLTHDGWMADATGEVDLVLDLWEPIDAPAGRPAVVVIHGGGSAADVSRQIAEGQRRVTVHQKRSVAVPFRSDIDELWDGPEFDVAAQARLVHESSLGESSVCETCSKFRSAVGAVGVQAR